MKNGHVLSKCIRWSTIIVILCAVASPPISRWEQERRWRIEFNRIGTLLESLHLAPPQNCSPRQWRNAVGQLQAGLWNACFDSSRVPLSAMKDLCNDLENIKRETPASMKLLRVMWHRIGESSAQANDLISRLSPAFEEYLVGVD